MYQYPKKFLNFNGVSNLHIFQVNYYEYQVIEITILIMFCYY